MNDQTLQALTVLAEKLGTTAEYLWGALLKQAPISGAVDLFAICLFIGGIVWWVWLVYRKTRPDADDRWDTDAFPLLWIFTGLAVFFTVCIVLMLLPEVFAAFFNPDYWALKQLIK